MGWFALAAAVGFAAFFLVPRGGDDFQCENRGVHVWRWIVLLLAGFAIVAAILSWVVLYSDCTWVWKTGKAHWSLKIANCWRGGGWHEIVDRLGDGRIARILLGFVLGAGAAFVITQRFRDLDGIGDEGRWGLADWTAILAVGAGIAFLAIAAPYIDSWLPRLNGLKTSIIEFQVQRQNGHHVAIADNSELTNAPFALMALRDLPKRLQQDIDYSELIEKTELIDKIIKMSDNFRSFTSRVQDDIKKLGEVERRRGQLAYLRDLYSELFSPMSNCLLKSIEGRLSRQTIQEKLRPVVDKFEQMLLRDKRDQKEEDRAERWDGMLRLAQEIDKSSMSDVASCRNMAKNAAEMFVALEYKIAAGDPYQDSIFPNLSQRLYASYAYLTAALFLQFLQDNDVALAVLKENSTDADNDYAYYKLLSSLRWTQGRLTGSIVRPLQTWRDEVTRRKQRIRDHCNAVPTHCTPMIKEKLVELMRREDAAELVLMNNFAYYVAEDLARNVTGAASFTATADEFAERLKQAIDSHAPALSTDGIDRSDDYLDTYAYVRVVLESRKQAPDIGVFKKMSRYLKGLVERLERQLGESKDDVFGRFDAALLKLTRTHYASSVQLAGEEE